MSRPRTVLVIDDEHAIRWSVSGYLEDSGYVVFLAADGEEGLRLFERQTTDVVLTDMRMPKLDGLGVISAIRALSPSTPIIALTGDGSVRDEAIRTGAVMCMTKPILNLGDLVAAIEKVLA
jgi:CheY-like chemotaxis protein